MDCFVALASLRAPRNDDLANIAIRPCNDESARILHSLKLTRQTNAQANQ